MQVNNFQMMEEADAYIKRDEFAENPLGVEFDPDKWSREILAKMKPDGSQGLSVDEINELTKRPNIGPDWKFHQMSSRDVLRSVVLDNYMDSQELGLGLGLM